MGRGPVTSAPRSADGAGDAGRAAGSSASRAVSASLARLHTTWRSPVSNVPGSTRTGRSSRRASIADPMSRKGSRYWSASASDPSACAPRTVASTRTGRSAVAFEASRKTPMASWSRRVSASSTTTRRAVGAVSNASHDSRSQRRRSSPASQLSSPTSRQTCTRQPGLARPRGTADHPKAERIAAVAPGVQRRPQRLLSDEGHDARSSPEERGRR
jgi:hypothetical protein